jgi:hypothetical protein
MKIGYGKVGRSMPLTLEGCGTVGGDVECVPVVKDLALRHPEHTFVLVGRNSGEDPESVDLPSNVVNPWSVWRVQMREWLNANNIKTGGSGISQEDQIKICNWYQDIITPTFLGLDHLVLWLGQHGSSNYPTPKVKDRSVLTRPHDWEILYVAYLLLGLNAWRDKDPVNHEEVWLNADARNYHKMRNLKWPCRHPVLAQFHSGHKIKHERYGDTKVEPPWGRHAMNDGHLWHSEVKYIYSRLEICALTPLSPHGELAKFSDDWAHRLSFGIFINEARPIRNTPKLSRRTALKEYVLPLEPAYVFGKWSDEGQFEVGIDIEPVPFEQYFPLMSGVRSTLTTPSSGSGWATTKPWEAFAAGTVCFFHPEYDTQNHILKDAHPDLKDFLRVRNPEELKTKVAQLDADAILWKKMVHLQKEHFDMAIGEMRYQRLIEERIGL